MKNKELTIHKTIQTIRQSTPSLQIINYCQQSILCWSFEAEDE